MFVNSIPIDVVSDAYDIAASYLKRIGRVPYTADIHQRLYDSIVEDYRAGRTNKLLLANRAILRMEGAHETQESSS
jgi:hypothetical protein